MILLGALVGALAGYTLGLAGLVTYFKIQDRCRIKRAEREGPVPLSFCNYETLRQQHHGHVT